MGALGLADLKILEEGASDDGGFSMGAAATLGFIPDLGPCTSPVDASALLAASLARLARQYVPSTDGTRLFEPRGIKDCIRRPHVAHLNPATFTSLARLLVVAAYGFAVRPGCCVVWGRVRIRPRCCVVV